ncbi:MAG: hypothetical protein KAQ68_06415 [Clostridiales bacterium]|nr:hypothetical protein [Clostridiales bacterium]
MKISNLRRPILLVFCMLLAFMLIVLLIITPSSTLDTTLARDSVVENHVEYTGADNAVSAIYLNFRLWDTLFEALVLLVSAVAVISFSRSEDTDEG